KHGLCCIDATVRGDASFHQTTIEGNARFDGATIEGGVYFEEAIVNGDVSFEEATIGEEATIQAHAWFTGARIKGHAKFRRAIIRGMAWFDRARVEGSISFLEATIEGVTFFATTDTTFLTFEGARFGDLRGQERACRAAKMIHERQGERERADYHFYREMEALRKQKRRPRRWLESPVQYVFGYGVKPFRVIGTWLSVVLILAFVYWLGDGVSGAVSFWQNLYFSVVTSATPGYGGYDPNPGFTVLATAQAIFGTFMWATFIVTFARKFMR
ncbi:MAG: pentapeptide repeat-containing protein, partial [Candidatus Thorarchaeota archaeon]